MTDEQRIIEAQAAYERATAAREEAVAVALRARSVTQARIAEITGVSRETVRVWRQEAGIPADERYVRKVTKEQRCM